MDAGNINLNFQTKAITTKWEDMLIAGVLFYVLVQSLFGFLERAFFWGELFVLLSFLCIFKVQYNSRSRQKPMLFMIYLWLLFFPIYGLLVSRYFNNAEFDTLFYLRHLSFFYYAAFALFAFKYAPKIIHYVKKMGLLIFLPLLFGILFSDAGLCLPISLGFLLMAMSVKEKKIFYYLSFAFALFTLSLSTGSGTNKFILLMYILFVVLNEAAHFIMKYVPAILTRVLTILITIAIILFFIRYLSSFYEFTTQSALLGLSIANLEQTSQNFGTDLGGFWRLVLWSHLYGRFLENPLGLGLGTPLFAQWLDGYVALHLDVPGENYVQGAHNSFITFIARMGVPALVYFSFLFFYITSMSLVIFRKLKFRPFQTSEGKLLSSVFLTLIAMCISSSFNVLLESPIYASGFWFFLGLFVRLFGDLEGTSKIMNSLDGTQQST